MNELLTRLVGAHRCAELLAQVHVPPQLASADPAQPSRGAVAMAMAMALGLVLFEDLLARVPSGAELFRRLLVPLGYQEVGHYPLEGIHMTGRVFTHAELPEHLPQYFVSELHVERLDGPAQRAVTRTVGDSVDPLDEPARALLEEAAGRGWMTLDCAARLVGMLACCFGRHHPEPRLADYHTLLSHSAEMAWIATEGNACNHATDRVPDVEALAETLRGDWPLKGTLKDTIERSRSGRVRQTALRADPVVRWFRDAEGARVAREVPGSFFEFISRDVAPDGGLDLTFDASNAQGIFRMTATDPDPLR